MIGKPQPGSGEDPLVTVFESVGVSAEMEAQAVRALLESQDIDSIVVRANVPEIPVGSVKVRVVGSLDVQALQLLREAEQAGPAAAEAAEAESEI